MISINFGFVFLAAVVGFIVGFLLHGPLLGKMWMRLAGIVPTGNEKFADMIPQMVWNLVVNIVTAYGIALLAVLTNASLGNWGSTLHVMIVATLVWGFFTIPATSMEVIWMGKKFPLWLFDLFASLVVMLAMGITVAL